MPHWFLMNTNKAFVHEFDTNAGGGVQAELQAARQVASAWVAQNGMKVVLCSPLRVITPANIPAPPAPSDDPYP